MLRGRRCFEVVGAVEISSRICRVGYPSVLQAPPKASRPFETVVQRPHKTVSQIFNNYRRGRAPRGNLLSAHALGLQADFLLVVISARLLSVSPSGSRRNIIQTLSKVFVCETIDDGFATAVARLGKDPSSVYSH